jgi:uncharacterized membrane protein YcaP (DUF421 family)
LVEARPRLLVHRGRLLSDALRAERVTREEIGAALRAQGVGELETDGTFSVLQRLGGATAMANVRGADQPPSEPARK